MSEIIGIPEIFFVTTNLNKYRELNVIFNQFSSFKLKHVQKSLIEIQSLDLEEIATFSLKKFSRTSQIEPVFVEDSGLFIDKLNGFPGPYSAYVYKTLGLRGILNLMQEIRNRKAYFQSSIALKIENSIEIFTERVNGTISNRISNSGWGYDPIFIPEKENGQTFGELGSKKNRISHRFLAALKLIKFLKKFIYLAD
ncbi:MAG: RdgB/HAM1 family non-canonical purine NTP pyrophosphatase [Promethearchaeota archaeon]